MCHEVFQIQNCKHIERRSTHTHIYTIYILFNNIFIDVLGHKFYFSMEFVNLCVIIQGYNPQKS